RIFLWLGYELYDRFTSGFPRTHPPSIMPARHASPFLSKGCQTRDGSVPASRGESFGWHLSEHLPESWSLDHTFCLAHQNADSIVTRCYAAPDATTISATPRLLQGGTHCQHRTARRSSASGKRVLSHARSLCHVRPGERQAWRKTEIHRQAVTAADLRAGSATLLAHCGPWLGRPLARRDRIYGQGEGRQTPFLPGPHNPRGGPPRFRPSSAPTLTMPSFHIRI
ncbi:hypothetical protein MAPG_06103, partial [Magnaporthiopsis poae ATCC 64411]